MSETLGNVIEYTKRNKIVVLGAGIGLLLALSTWLKPSDTPTLPVDDFQPGDNGGGGSEVPILEQLKRFSGSISQEWQAIIERTFEEAESNSFSLGIGLPSGFGDLGMASTYYKRIEVADSYDNSFEADWDIQGTSDDARMFFDWLGGLVGTYDQRTQEAEEWRNWWKDTLPNEVT
jgi:hypothetical protein